MAVQLTDAQQSELAIAAAADLVHVRQLLRAESVRAGLGLVDQTKLITAGSELARNILTYADGARGSLSVEHVGQRGRRGLRATFTDDGPGIDDLDKALTDGYSTGGGLGLGLPGSRRLVDEMTITSSREAGTTVVIVKWAR